MSSSPFVSQPKPLDKVKFNEACPSPILTFIQPANQCLTLNSDYPSTSTPFNSHYFSQQKGP